MTPVNLARIQQTHAQSGGEFMGSVIWWSISSANISSEALKLKADALGFPTKYLPSPISPISAFKRARVKAQVGLTHRNLRLEGIADENQSRDHIVLGLCERKVDPKTETVDFSQISTIKFDKATHTIQSRPYHDLEDRLREYYSQCLLHSQDDIRQIITMITGEVGLTLRSSGGVYWIPAQHQALLDQASDLMLSISGNNVIHQLPLYQAETTVTELTGTANDTLTSEMEALNTQVHQLLEDEKTKPKTLLRRIEDVKLIRARINLFSGVLNFAAEELQSKLLLIEGAINHSLNPSPVRSIPASAPTATPAPTPNATPPTGKRAVGF